MSGIFCLSPNRARSLSRCVREALIWQQKSPAQTELFCISGSWYLLLIKLNPHRNLNLFLANNNYFLTQALLVNPDNQVVYTWRKRGIAYLKTMLSRSLKTF